MDWIVPPTPDSSNEVLTLNGTVFRDRTFKEVIKIKWGHKSEALV